MTVSGCSISIVTATLNRRVMLERAIESAMAQSTQAMEHIVIDAASTDGTLEMLKRFPHLRVVSEPDRNLYEGWNKGLRLARGDYICILNSDDELPYGALAEVTRVCKDHPEAEMISGAVEILRDVDKLTTTRAVLDDARFIHLREQDIGPGVPLTNGRYISRRLLDRIGLFDERYDVVSDRQFFLRALLANARNATTTAILYRYHVHGGSLSLNDRMPSERLAKQCLDAALDGFREHRDTAGRAAFRRWHAWAAFYLAGLQARRAGYGEAARTCGKACSTDIWWPFRLPPMIARHLRERGARQGREVSSHG
ncbi:MAG: glycosyltransferase [Beijerinckiaceae bacterium]